MYRNLTGNADRNPRGGAAALGQGLTVRGHLTKYGRKERDSKGGRAGVVAASDVHPTLSKVYNLRRIPTVGFAGTAVWLFASTAIGGAQKERSRCTSLIRQRASQEHPRPTGSFIRGFPAEVDYAIRFTCNEAGVRQATQFLLTRDTFSGSRR